MGNRVPSACANGEFTEIVRAVAAVPTSDSTQRAVASNNAATVPYRLENGPAKHTSWPTAKRPS